MTRQLRLRWTSDATADLESIIRYIRQNNPRQKPDKWYAPPPLEAARRVANRILREVRRLRSMPFSGRDGVAEGTRELVIPRLPWVVVYRVTGSGVSGDTVEILRIWPGGQLRD
jgi:addiction module RelE/StbE family toxin